MSDENDKDAEMDEISNKEHLRMSDKISAKMHQIMRRSDTGRVEYPRREYLQNRANARKAAYDEEQRRLKQGK